VFALKRLVCLLVCCLLWLGACALAEAPEPGTWVAGNFWADVAGVNAGGPLRLWMAFYQAPPEEELLPAGTMVAEVWDGFLGLYEAQTEQLRPATAVTEDDLVLYLVDTRFEHALELTGYEGTLDDLYELASSPDMPRAFAGRQNPLGVLLTGMTAYAGRLLDVAGVQISEEALLREARGLLANQADADAALDGFLLLLAPLDCTEPPTDTEIRFPIKIEETAKKPAGHSEAAVSGIASSSATLEQGRLRSYEYIDVRLYDGAKQLTFRQKTGKMKGKGACLDLFVYAAPGSVTDLNLGLSGLARAALLERGVTGIHVVLATPGSVKPYRETWMDYPLE
jgi:hypothetical protein